jgi:hypothetical protein
LAVTSSGAISARLRIKGVSEPLHVFELEGVGTLRTGSLAVAEGRIAARLKGPR